MLDAEMQQEPGPQDPSPASGPRLGPTPRPSPPPAVVGQHGAAVPGSREERNRLKRIPVLETRTPIPEGLDAPGAGANRVDAWLRRTFGMSAEEATEVTGHSSLRQIVHRLDQIVAGEVGAEPDEGEAPGQEGEGPADLTNPPIAEDEVLPGTPITADQAASLPGSESHIPLEPPPPNAESEAGSGLGAY